MERADTPHWDKVDGFALAGSVAAHALLAGLFWLSLRNEDVLLPQPKPMAVEILAESDLEATAPDPSSDAPAAMKAMEEGPVEDAPAPAADLLPAPEPVALPEPEPAPPLPVVKPTPQPRPVQKATPPKPVDRPLPKPTVAKAVPKPLPKPAPKAAVRPTPKVTPKPVTKPAPQPAARAAARPTATKTSSPARTASGATKSAVKPSTKTGTGTGKGTATRPTGDLAGMVSAVGKGPSRSRSTSAPGTSAAQIKQSITTSIGNQVKTPWNQCKVTGIDVDALLTTVKFRLNRDGSLAGFNAVATSGVNDSNRNQQSRHQECAKKAIQQASPFTGLPPEHYAYWQNYEFKFQKR